MFLFRLPTIEIVVVGSNDEKLALALGRSADEVGHGGGY